MRALSRRIGSNHSNEAETVTERRVLAFGALLLVDMVLSIVMLLTDKNLQTDFGAQSAYRMRTGTVFSA